MKTVDPDTGFLKSTLSRRQRASSINTHRPSGGGGGGGGGSGEGVHHQQSSSGNTSQGPWSSSSYSALGSSSSPRGMKLHQRIAHRLGSIGERGNGESSESYTDTLSTLEAEVRDETAHLAQLALNEDHEANDSKRADTTDTTEFIDAVSEPPSPASETSPLLPPPARMSLLSTLLNSVLETEAQPSSALPSHVLLADSDSTQYVHASPSQISESSHNPKGVVGSQEIPHVQQGSAADVESQRSKRKNTTHSYLAQHVRSIFKSPRDATNTVVLRPLRALPAVMLGALLNVLDALSYGMILFPLGEAIFAETGADGISMFYVSCIVSQLVFSLGGSIFKGGIGSEMIEVVPFFHQMAYSILAEIGSETEEQQHAVMATTILSFAVSSIITGLVFFVLGAARLGSITGFFPRHILVGCIGGVGLFLVLTGLEVSARLDGALAFTKETFQMLFSGHTVLLWAIPLGMSFVLLLLERKIDHPLVVPAFFTLVPIVFYTVVALIPNYGLKQLRADGWVFDAPQANQPWWNFYTYYDFKAVNWSALLRTLPTMFALTFFGILHVPINVPALGVTTHEDNLNVDRELIAHGISNALSGLVGSIQNYLVYTNSILFIRTGGNSRLAGVMLAIATAGIMIAGPAMIGYIPVMMVAALIYVLGFSLLVEALIDTWGRVNRLEYLTILAITISMGTWNFVYGILIGIVLASFFFVVQASRKPAIRGTYSGAIAKSTVRRHPAQQKFLKQVGHQIYVCKLGGYMFFGTISGVETKIRGLLNDHSFGQQPIQYLLMDFTQVYGLDYSAGETFIRLHRLVKTRDVQFIFCGIVENSEVSRAFQSVGIWDEKGGESVKMFDTLNEALESCENDLLRAYYAKRSSILRRKSVEHDLGE